MPDNSEYGILIVDDEEQIGRSIRRYLKRKGFTKIVSTLNGEQGILVLETEPTPFFLIISDQKMPGMSGSEFLEKSITISPESRRMLITGYADFNSIMEAVNRGMIHQFILKPWEPEDLSLRIMGELETFKIHEERKSLHKIIKRQNTKLFEFASFQKHQIDSLNTRLKEKKQEAEQLLHELRKAKKQAEFKATFSGLDAHLSRTIPITPANLQLGYALIKNNAQQILKAVADRNGFRFSPTPIPRDKNRATAVEDVVFEGVDMVIETAAIQAEDDLFKISDGQSDLGIIDAYEQLPQFDELAVTDGMITKEEQVSALEELQDEKNQGGQLTIDRMLVKKGALKREEVSLLFSKLALIETRLLDREFGDLLLEKNLASPKEIERAFRKQWNSFKDSGKIIPLGEFLIESKAITPEIRYEVLAAQNRAAQPDGKGNPVSDTSSDYSELIELKISEDQTEAWICLPKSFQGAADIEPVKRLIKKRGITYGIVTDEAIQQFLANHTVADGRLKIAQGVAPKAGRPGEILFHFNREERMAGVINEDGTIDFRVRGDAPHVEKGDLLAEKKHRVKPQAGVSIFGEVITAEEVDDATLEGGSGVEISEDGLKLYAAESGQPTIDAKGIISILDILTVNGDVNFKTGNIHFDGHVIVKGIIKEGFEVECEDLTAKEINGGVIRIRGDLKVSQGIVNSEVQTEGSVQAKFLNKTKLYAHGDMMITREIMESQICISGTLNNKTGRITGSTIAARKGIIGRQIGTKTAKSSLIKIGTDDHIKWLCGLYDLKLRTVQNAIEFAAAQKSKLDEAYNALHGTIAEHTYAQKKKTIKIQRLEKILKETRETDKASPLFDEFKEIRTSVHQGDERIKSIFKKQDILQDKANDFGKQLKELKQELETIQEEKKRIINKLETDNPVPEVKIVYKVFAGTQITATKGSMTLKQDCGPSKFYEIEPKNPNHPKQIVHQTLS